VDEAGRLGAHDETNAMHTITNKHFARSPVPNTVKLSLIFTSCLRRESRVSSGDDAGIIASQNGSRRQCLAKAASHLAFIIKH
jgi:hypothetical protein